MGRQISLATLAAHSKKSVEIAVAHLRLSTTTKFLMLLFAIGSALVTIASVLDKEGVDVPGNSLRWIYLFGTITATMIIWNGLVELVYLWLELRYFLRLVMLPSSQLLFKVWLNSVAAFISFDQLFRNFSVSGVPPQPLSSAERWICRLLLCFLLFTCLCVAVTAACNVAVAMMYSEGSRQKIVAAIQHAYVMYRLVRKKLHEGDSGDGNNGDVAARRQRKDRRGSGGSVEMFGVKRRVPVAMALPPLGRAPSQQAMPPPMLPKQQQEQQEPWDKDSFRLRPLSYRVEHDGHVPATTMTAVAVASMASVMAVMAPVAEKDKRGSTVLSLFSSIDASMLPLPPPANGTGPRLALQMGGAAAAIPSLQPSPQPQQQMLVSSSNGAATGTIETEKPVPVRVTIPGEEVGGQPAAAAAKPGDPTNPRIDSSQNAAAGSESETETGSESDGDSGGGCGIRHRSCDDSSAGTRGCCGLGTSARLEEMVSPPSTFQISDASRIPSASLQKAMQKIRDSEMLHVRRTLLAALEVYDWLREESLLDKSGTSHVDATLLHRAARLELHAIRKSGVRLIISPRALLDEMLTVYGGLSDLDIPSLGSIFQSTVWKCVGLLRDDDIIKRKNFKRIFRRHADRQIAWDALDGDKDGKLTREDVKAAVVSFLQQERSMALTVRAVRRLTWSLQSSLIAIINGIFLVPVYLTILDVVHFFNGGGGSKTSLDIFSVYVLVVSLIFSEQIKNVLLGCVFILTQQPFDVGEELVIEESPGWRVMGVVQDFNLFFLRVKKSTDGELVTLPLNKLASSRFTNLTRSDWKIEQNYFAVDASTPPSILQEMKAAAERVISRSKSEYDEMYGFLAVFHGFERPNKVVIRTFHRYKFNLAAPHKRIANARHGIISAIRETFDKHGIEFTELRMHMTAPPAGMQYMPGATAAVAAAAAGYGHTASDHPAMPAALDETAGQLADWKSSNSTLRGGGGRSGGLYGGG